MSQPYEAYQTEQPATTSGMFAGLSSTDKKFAVILMSIVLACLFVFGQLGSLSLGLFLLLFRWEERRVYLYPIRRLQSIRMKIVKGVVWEADPAKRRRFLRQRSELVPVDVTEVGDVGILHRRDLGRDAIVITGSGSHIASRDLAGQHQQHAQIAEAFKKVAAVPGYAVGVSQVYRRRPANLLAHHVVMDESLHPDVALPEALLKPEAEHSADDKRFLNIRQVMLEHEQLIAQYAGEITMAMVFTIKREGVLTTATPDKGLTELQQKRLPIHQVATAAMDSLAAAGVNDLSLLNGDEMQDYVREGWDVADLDDYHLDVARRYSGETDHDPTDPIHWPSQRIVVYDDCSLVDNSYTAVIRLRSAPKWALPHTMRQLHGMDVPWVTITQVGETVSSNREYFWLNMAIPIRGDLKEKFGADRNGPRSRNKDEALRQRQIMLDDSGFSQHYSLLIAVSDTDRDRMNHAVEDVLRTCRRLGTNPVRITGEAMQLRALWSATTGMNML